MWSFARVISSAAQNIFMDVARNEQTNNNRLNLVCWHNWIWETARWEIYKQTPGRKSSLIGCYGRITNITASKFTTYISIVFQTGSAPRSLYFNLAHRWAVTKIFSFSDGIVI